MKKNKLLELLTTFDQKEWLEFGQYVRSPFFNQTESLIRLTDQLADHFKNKPQAELPTKQQLYHLACPSRSYSELDYNRLCSRLLALASQYIAYQAWQKDGIMQRAHTLQAFRERNLHKHFQHELRKAKHVLDHYPLRDHQFYQQQYLIAREEELHLAKSEVQSLGPQVQVASDHFDAYLTAQKLQHLCSIDSLNKVKPDTYQVHFAEQTMHMAEKLQHIPIISIYRRLYLLLTSSAPVTYFEELKARVVTLDEELSEKDMNFTYTVLVNFCIRSIRQGKKEFAAPLLFLYKSALDKGLFLDKGMISPWHFKNVIKLGLGLQRYDWVREFIHQYGPKLEAAERTEAMHFNLADLYYHQKEYDKAQIQLREVEFSHLRYYLHGRILLAKIYYTTKAWEALDSLLSSFRVYLLRSKKMSRDEKRAYLNFIRLLDKILRSLPDKHAKVREQIQQTVVVTDRSWLLKIVADK